ncbi:MAG TPA: arginine decarboxylase, pyruvoyl-dependent [Pirellulales bacterium]|nr:arginine decarboxylase, pyruvoyl-dependent [Pirellulales bacterium]
MTNPFVPQKAFFTKGVGRHKDELQSFEAALREAGVEHVNLVSVSSILPPRCKIVTRDEGLKLLQPGQIVFAVIARMATNEPHRLVAASIGAAVPADHDSYGYLSEHHAFGETDQRAGDRAEDIAAEMLATTLGIPFDPNKDWDELQQQFKMSGKIVKTRNVTQSAEGDKHGLWTTVVAALVFCE